MPKLRCTDSYIPAISLVLRSPYFQLSDWLRSGGIQFPLTNFDPSAGGENDEFLAMRLVCLFSPREVQGDNYSFECLVRNGLNGYRIAYLYSLESRDITAILFLEKRVLTG